MKAQTPSFGFGLTSQMSFSASCNCPNIPLAPNKAISIPVIAAQRPGLGSAAFAAIS
jgi:hypothetical protein